MDPIVDYSAIEIGETVFSTIVLMQYSSPVRGDKFVAPGFTPG